MSAPFLFLIGENGAFLLPPKSKAPLFFAEPNARTRETLLDALAKAPRAPVLILADTLGQSYTQTSFPRLGRKDRKALLARRLQTLFPDTSEKAALTLKGTEALLVALHPTPVLTLWREALAAAPNPKEGTLLLPLEGLGLARRLGAPQKGWHLFLTLNRAAGCRQIVTKDGALLFTRLTPLPLLEASPPFVAASLASDLQATRAYLARFGLLPSTPLALTALLPKALHAPLEGALQDIATLHCRTPAEAAQALDFLPQSEVFSDALLLQSFRKPRLCLRSETERTACRKRHVQALKRTALTLTLTALLLFLGTEGATFLALAPTHRQAQARVASLQQEIETSRQTIARMEAPLKARRAALVRERLFKASTRGPWPLFEALIAPLTQAGSLLTAKWSGTDTEETLRLTLQLKASPLDPSAPRRRTEQTAEAMKEALPNCRVSVEAWPTARTESGIKKDLPALSRASYLLTCEARP